MCPCVFCENFNSSIPRQDCENNPVCVVSDGRMFVPCFLFVLNVCVRVCVCVCVCVRWGDCSGRWETGGLTRMYGCFKIHLQTFFYRHSLLLSPHKTPHPTSSHTHISNTHTHTHTHTLQQQPSLCHCVHYYSILPELTNQRRAWNPELQWPEPRLSPCNGGKTFISLLSCLGPIAAVPWGYLDPL